MNSYLLILNYDFEIKLVLMPLCDNCPIDLFLVMLQNILLGN